MLSVTALRPRHTPQPMPRTPPPTHMAVCMPRQGSRQPYSEPHLSPEGAPNFHPMGPLRPPPPPPPPAQKGILQRHKTIRLGTLNCRTAHRAQDIDLLTHDAEAEGLGLLALQETRETGQGIRQIVTSSGKQWTYAWSGDPVLHAKGVGFLLSPELARCVVGRPTFTSDRVMSLTLHGTVKTTLVVVYAPTEGHPDKDKDSFYHSLHAVTEAVPPSHCIFILGDFNARVGCTNAAWPGVLGPHCTLPANWRSPHRDTGPAPSPLPPPKLSDLTPNDNGARLLAFCQEMHLAVTNSFFPHRPSHKATWYSPAGPRAINDYILVSQRCRSWVHDTKVRPAAISHSTDHRLVVSSTCLHLRRRPRTQTLHDRALLAPGPKLDGGLTLAQASFKRAMGRLGIARIPQGPLRPSEAEWRNFKAGITDLANHCLPARSTAPRRPGISAETARLASVRTQHWAAVLQARNRCRTDTTPLAAAALKAAEAAHTQARKATQASSRRDKIAQLKEHEAALNRAHFQHQTAKVFDAVNKMTGRGLRATIGAIMTPKGIVTTPQEVANALACHAHQVFNNPSVVLPDTLHSLPAPCPPQPLLGSSPTGLAKPCTRQTTRLAHTAKPPPQAHSPRPSSAGCTMTPDPARPPDPEEVRAAIAALKNTAAGVCGISAPILKYGGQLVVDWLHRVIVATWTSNLAPSEWKGSLFTFLYKGKGDRLDPDNFRGISLLSVCAKVYTQILLARLRPILEPGLSESQCGFRPGRGCPDLHFSLRRLTEIAHAHRAPLWVAFVDFKKAFDSVNRAALWAVLASRGVPSKLITLVQDLYDGCEGRVRVDSAVSDPFSIGTGVRQGCALSPLLFSTFIDAVVREAIPLTIAQVSGYQVGVEANGLLTSPSLPTGPSQVRNLTVTDLLYADDVTLVARSKEGLARMLTALQRAATRWGLAINVRKTKAMVFHPLARPFNLPSPIRLHGGAVEFVEYFTYLGSIWTHTGSLDREVSRRAGAARGAINQLQPLWKKRGVERSLKLRIAKALIPPALSYSCETWCPSTRHVDCLNVVLHQGLRRALGVSPLEKVSNDTIRRTANVDEMGTYSRMQRLRYLGHVARGQDRLTHALLFATHPTHSACPRSRTRTNRTIIDQLREDIQALSEGGPSLNADWYAIAQDRPTWRNLTRHLSACNQTQS